MGFYNNLFTQIYEHGYAHAKEEQELTIKAIDFALDSILKRLEKLEQSICKHTNQEKKCKDCGKEL